jgi:hypothetical protein
MRRRRALAAVAALWCGLFGSDRSPREARADAAHTTSRAPAPIAAELARLDGQRVELRGGRYTIVDVAGEGAPLVGVVERRGAALWLVAERGPARRLTGPLARPRIAGPGYKVWVLGSVGADGSLAARRLGVLAPPSPASAHPMTCSRSVRERPGGARR